MQTQWEKSLNVLRNKISSNIFTNLFSKLKIASLNNNHATIIAPSDLDLKEIAPYKLLTEISWEEANGKHIDLDFRHSSIPREPSTYSNSSIKEFTPSVPLNSIYRFENFIPGDKAQLAFNAAFAVAENPDGNKYNPLFIYGASGLGKTHLLQAIGNYVLESDSTKRVRYLTAYDFQQQYIKSVRDQRITEMSAYYRNEVDVLLIDDIQNWSGKDETQNEFFHIFNALHQAGKQIVLTSDAPAIEVKSLSDRLVSRFSWGLTVDIQPPNLETREAILRKKAEEKHIDIDDEVILYLAENIESNVRFLESAVIKLTVQASIMHHDIDIHLARKVVADIVPTIRRRVSMDSIVSAVSRHFEVPEEKLLAPGRGTKEIAHARQVAMFLMKELTTLSLQSIGTRFGGKDHSTVVHAIKTIKKEMETTPSFERTIENLKAEIHD
jgi:chromosomal replication initiator protein